MTELLPRCRCSSRIIIIWEINSVRRLYVPNKQELNRDDSTASISIAYSTSQYTC